MRKKLQVFISSTYNDLIEERQAAVEAILNTGHIPAGMELFSAGNESQLDTVKRWIDESDIYLLILGGRYGTLEPTSRKSYTQLEYEYALGKDMPLFAVVISDEALESKVRQNGTVVMELENQEAYKEFKAIVLSKICRYFNDKKDIKLAVHETINSFIARFEFSGWVSGRDIPDVESILKENLLLAKENLRLKHELDKCKEKQKQDNLLNGYEYELLVDSLNSVEIVVPAKISSTDDLKISLLDLFFKFRTKLAIGVENSTTSKEMEIFIFYNIAARLLTYGLVEKVKVAGVRYERIQTSKTGHKFISLLEINKYVND